jgi:hypothetical protein
MLQPYQTRSRSLTIAITTKSKMFAYPLLSFAFYKDTAFSKNRYFSKLCDHASYLGPKLCGADVALTSLLCVSAMLLLRSARS